MMQQLGKYIYVILSFISIATIGRSQESAKQEFKSSIDLFKNALNKDNYELLLHKNIYVYDLNKPMETSWQLLIKNGDRFYYQTEGLTMVSFSDCRIVVDSTSKTIYLADLETEIPPMNFLFSDSLLSRVNIEKKELKDRLVFNINMYSLNTEIESVQYHFDKSTKMLKNVIIYLNEGSYYEDENHIEEKQSPVQEIVITKLTFNKANLPVKEDFILNKKNEYIVASNYSGYVFKDIRKK